MLDGGREVASGDLRALLSGASDRLRIDVRGDRSAFGTRLREAGFDVEVGTTSLRVGRRPGLEAEVFRVAHALGAEVRYLGEEIRSLEELFLELVERQTQRRA
jgi:hypothetical protein